jgi:hypothetical protein
MEVISTAVHLIIIDYTTFLNCFAFPGAGPVNSQYQERGDSLVQEAEAKLRYWASCIHSIHYIMGDSLSRRLRPNSGTGLMKLQYIQ